MTVIRANFNDLNNANWYKVGFGGFKEYPELYSKVFNVKDSKRATEYVTAMSGVAMPSTKAEGSDMTYDDPKQLYDGSVSHTTYAQGIRLTMEALQDDEYNVLGEKLFRSMGRGFAQRVETEAWNVFNRAFTAGYTGPDGVVLCATTHPKNPDEATTYISNRLATDSDLSVSTLKTMLTNFKNMTDERALKFTQVPKYLIVPTDLEWTAKEILTSAQEPYVADNTNNVLQNSLELLVVPYLTDTDAWFIASDKADHTLNFFWRMKFTIDRDNDFDSRDAKYGAVMRFSTYWEKGWQGIYGTPGA